MDFSSALLTDRYELTMIDAAFQSGTANRRSVFELFTRSLPQNRCYGVVAGTGRFLEALENFRFNDAELNWLAEQGIVTQETLNWLADYRFSGNIWGYPEGEVFFAGSPLLQIESTFAEAVILETLALSIFNYDSAVATSASRIVHSAAGKPLAEMGSRRINEKSAIAAARAAYIAGFSATSNLEAGRTYGIPTMGTAAHSFTLLHDSEKEAFAAQVKALGTDTTLLVDTYDIETGVRNAVEVAGTELGGVRIDSGDLQVVVKRVREKLDTLGAVRTKITVTNDLDEFTIAALSHTPVDNFGVGSSVVTGSGSVAMGMVYKLVARTNNNGDWVSVAKKSSGKLSTGGSKTVSRKLSGAGVATAENITIHTASLENLPVSETTDSARSVLVQLVKDGNIDASYTGKSGIVRARKQHASSMLEMPLNAFRLTSSEQAIPTVYETA